MMRLNNFDSEVMDINNLSPEDMQKAIELLLSHEEMKKFNKIDTFIPYGWQSDYY